MKACIFEEQKSKAGKMANPIAPIDWLNPFGLQRVFASTHCSILGAIFPVRENRGLILPSVSGK